jgi:2-oxoglutarate ferredoxin oxidoreductase subunit alpha
MAGAKIGLIYFGSTEPAVEEARVQMAKEGLQSDSLRVRAIPFTVEVKSFIQAHERCYVVEMNRDGQLHQLLTLEYPELALKLHSIAYTDGLPMTAKLVREAVHAQEAK